MTSITHLIILSASLAFLSACGGGSAGGDLVPLPACTVDCPSISNFSPLAAQGGSQVEMQGENFHAGMTVEIDGESVAVEVTSPTVATITLPSGSPGELAAKITSNQEDNSTAVYRLSSDSIPLITESEDQVCAGKVYYNAAGEQTTGTKDCSGSAAPSDCNSDGQIGCVTTAGFAAAGTSGLATKIVSGNTVAGVAGTITLPAEASVVSGVQFGAGGTEFTGTTTLPAIAHVSNGVQYGAGGTEYTGTGAGPSACTSDGQTACVADASFPAADASLAVAGNIKSGVTIAGTAGDYPSSTYPLPSASGTADLDNATFNAKIKSATAFEYWTSAGTHQTGAGDADITAANIASGTSIFGTAGSVLSGAAPTCTSDGETGCTTDATFKAVDTSAINQWDIKTGKTVGGISGSVKTNCRNAANLSIFDRATANATVDWWDTIDNYNNDAVALPTAQPSGWTSANLCGKELWSDDTADGACDSAGDDCLMKDNVSGLTWSEGGAVHNTDSADTADTWDNAIAHCQGLNTEDSGAGYGGITSWRLPTQMELQTASQHGIRQLGYKLSGTERPSGDTLDNNSFFIADVDQGFWSATTQSDNTANAWRVNLHNGRTVSNDKTNSYRILCVSP